MPKPEVVEVQTIDLFGGSRTIIARVRYGGEILTLSFTGKQRGSPGHVTLDVDEQRVPIPFPGRFGKQFNEEWVRAYFQKEVRDA